MRNIVRRLGLLSAACCLAGCGDWGNLTDTSTEPCVGGWSLIVAPETIEVGGTGWAHVMVFTTNERAKECIVQIS